MWTVELIGQGMPVSWHSGNIPFHSSSMWTVELIVAQNFSSTMPTPRRGTHASHRSRGGSRKTPKLKVVISGDSDIEIIDPSPQTEQSDRMRKSTRTAALKKKSYADDDDDDDLGGIKEEKGSDVILDSSVAEIERCRDVFSPQPTPKTPSPVKSKSSTTRTPGKRAQCSSDASDIVPSASPTKKSRVLQKDEVDSEPRTPTKSKPIPIAKVSKGKLVLKSSNLDGDTAELSKATLADKVDDEETDDDAMLVSPKSIANMSPNELHALMAMIDASLQTPKTKVNQYMVKKPIKVQSSDEESEGDISPMEIDSTNDENDSNGMDNSDTLEDNEAEEDDEDMYDKKARKVEVKGKGKMTLKALDDQEDEDGNFKVRKGRAKGQRAFKEEDKDEDDAEDDDENQNEGKGKGAFKESKSAVVDPVSDDIKKLMRATSKGTDKHGNIIMDYSLPPAPKFKCEVTIPELLDSALRGTYEGLPPLWKASFLVYNEGDLTTVLLSFIYKQHERLLPYKSAIRDFVTISMKHGLFLNPSRGDPRFFEPGPVGDIVSQMGTRQICLMFGFSGRSKVAEAEARPDGEKWYKYIRLLPLNQEWERYIAFMAINIGQDGFYVPTGRKQASLEFSTKWGKMGAGNGEDDDEDGLFAVLKGAKFGKSQSGHASSSRTPGNIITGHSTTPLALNHWDQIAVYDCTRFFQSKDSRKLDESFDLAKLSLYSGFK
ncbi:hypothetical protein BKA93DRAFT_750259 [Sparassis latifolia]